MKPNLYIVGDRGWEIAMYLRTIATKTLSQNVALSGCRALCDVIRHANLLLWPSSYKYPWPGKSLRARGIFSCQCGFTTCHFSSDLRSRELDSPRAFLYGFPRPSDAGGEEDEQCEVLGLLLFHVAPLRFYQMSPREPIQPDRSFASQNPRMDWDQWRQLVPSLSGPVSSGGDPNRGLWYSPGHDHLSCSRLERWRGGSSVQTSAKKRSFKDVKSNGPGVASARPRALSGSTYIVEHLEETPTTKLEDSHTMISGYNFNRTSLICRLNGLWPSASGLREWIKQTWAVDHELYLCFKGSSRMSMQRWLPDFNP